MSVWGSGNLKYKLKRFLHAYAYAISGSAIAFIFAFGMAYFSRGSLAERLNLFVLQQFYDIRGERPAPEDVVIASLDDDTYAKLGISPRLPFPRSVTASVLERLAAAKPGALIIDASIPPEGLDKDAEDRIEAALRASPSTIWSGKSPSAFARDATEHKVSSIPSDERFIKAAKMELPMLLLSSQGYRYLLTLDMSKTAKVSDRVPLSRPIMELAERKIRVPSPFDLINFYGPQGTIKRVSFTEVLSLPEDKLREFFENKIVFFGYQSVQRERGTSDKDEFNIPLSPSLMFGVEIHANIAGNLLDGSFLSVPSRITALNVIYLAAMLFAMFSFYLKPEKSTPLVTGIVVLFAIFSYYAFSKYHFWMAPSFVILAGFLSVTLGWLFHYVILNRFKAYYDWAHDFEAAEKSSM